MKSCNKNSSAPFWTFSTPPPLDCAHSYTLSYSVTDDNCNYSHSSNSKCVKIVILVIINVYQLSLIVEINQRNMHDHLYWFTNNSNVLRQLLKPGGYCLSVNLMEKWLWTDAWSLFVESTLYGGNKGPLRCYPYNQPPPLQSRRSMVGTYIGFNSGFVLPGC